MDKKKIIIIVSLLLLYGLIMLLIFRNKDDNNPNNNKDNNEVKENNNVNENDEVNNKYLVLENDSTWKYNKEWSSTSKSLAQRSGNFKIYSDNNYIGEYKLVYSNAWNVFDENDRYVSYTGKLFAFSNDFDIKLIRTNIVNITEDDKNYILSGYDNKNFDNLLSNDMINIDLDNNGVIDKIVAISNIGDEDSINYNLVYIILNGRLYTLLNENLENIYESSVYNINRIFEYENEKYIIIKETKNFIGDNIKIINHMFKIENDNFVEIMHD